MPMTQRNFLWDLEDALTKMDEAVELLKAVHKSMDDLIEENARLGEEMERLETLIQQYEGRE